MSDFHPKQLLVMTVVENAKQITVPKEQFMQTKEAIFVVVWMRRKGGEK